MKLIDDIRRDNLALLVLEHGTLVALARQLERDPSQVSQWLNGSAHSVTGKQRGMRPATARYIEEKCGKPMGWLDIEHPQAEGPRLEQAPEIRGKEVPVISWVQAGEFTEAVESWSSDEWVDTSAPVHRHTFALRVKGDSMEPDFPAGVIIVVEPDLEPNPGDYVVVRNGGGEATFKQLVRDGADWYLKPINPRYPIKPLGSSHIVGVVREMIKKFR